MNIISIRKFILLSYTYRYIWCFHLRSWWQIPFPQRTDILCSSLCKILTSRMFSTRMTIISTLYLILWYLKHLQRFVLHASRHEHWITISSDIDISWATVLKAIIVGLSGMIIDEAAAVGIQPLFIYLCLIYTYPGICVSVGRYTNTTDTQIFTYRPADLQMGPVSVWARAKNKLTFHILVYSCIQTSLNSIHDYPLNNRIYSKIPTRQQNQTYLSRTR